MGPLCHPLAISAIRTSPVTGSSEIFAISLFLILPINTKWEGDKRAADARLLVSENSLVHRIKV